MLFFSTVNISEEEFEEFYEQYYIYAWFECRKYIKNDNDLKDVLQDLFLAIYKNFDKSKVKSGELAYIIKVARNHALNYIRENKKRKNDIYIDDYPYELADDRVCDPLEYLLNKEIMQEISKELHNLPIKYADVLSFTFKYNNTPKEIADLLQIPLKTVYGRLKRGKRLLLKQLEKNYLDNLSVKGGVENEK